MLQLGPAVSAPAPETTTRCGGRSYHAGLERYNMYYSVRAPQTTYCYKAIKLVNGPFFSNIQSSIPYKTHHELLLEATIMVSWRNLFVAYAVLGVVALWGSMFVNGTLDAIDKAKASSELPSGRTLLTSFTGISVIDSALSTLVAFFDGITNGSVLQSHLLMVDLLAVIQCATIWLMVDGFSLQELDPFVRR